MSAKGPVPLLDELLARLHALPRKDREAVLSRLPEDQQIELQRRRLRPDEASQPQAREARFRGLSPWLMEMLASVDEAKKTGVRPDLTLSDATLTALHHTVAALAERAELSSETPIWPALVETFRSLWVPSPAAP